MEKKDMKRKKSYLYRYMKVSGFGNEKKSLVKSMKKINSGKHTVKKSP